MKKNTTLENPRKYQLLSTADFEDTIIKNQEPVVIIFVSEWSGNADIMDGIIERLSQEFEFNSELHFFRVDIEKQPKFSEFFGITTVPSIIMVNEGEVVECIKGFESAAKLREKIKEVYADFF